MGLLDKMNGLSMSAGANGSSDSVKENDLPARDEFIQVKKDALSLIIYELNKNTQSELNEDHVRKVISDVLERENPSVSRPDRAKIGNELYNDIMGYGPIDSLLSDPDVTEIMVNGPNKIFYEKRGRIQRSELCFRDNDHVMNIIDRIVSGVGRHIDEASPMVDARLADGSRVNAVIYPVALDGPILTIRRFPEHAITMEDLIAKESITREAATFLEQMVKAGYSILIGGGTSSGKTTFLNALSNAIPHEERIITIEDSAELQIQGVENLVRLEAKPANMEGNRAITIRDLIRTALRMAPNRIIVGEIRGEEAVDLLQAWNTGHDGSLGTAHANSTGDMISRVETMVLMGMELPLEAVRRQIASGVELLVHLERARDGKRQVAEIAEILGYEDGEVRMHGLYRREKDQLKKIGELQHREKLERCFGEAEL